MGGRSVVLTAGITKDCYWKGNVYPVSYIIIPIVDLFATASIIIRFRKNHKTIGFARLLFFFCRSSTCLLTQSPHCLCGVHVSGNGVGYLRLWKGHDKAFAAPDTITVAPAPPTRLRTHVSVAWLPAVAPSICKSNCQIGFKWCRMLRCQAQVMARHSTHGFASTPSHLHYYGG